MNINNQKYISLKEASTKFGYASDYIGYLIRHDLIEGRRKYTNPSWYVDVKSLFRYCEENNKKTNPRDFILLEDQWISLKVAARICNRRMLDL